jgi:oligopeptide/dipeptide ABC transporter ATP-binding protein
MEILEQVRMPRVQEVLRSYPHELSGGMRQRVMIGMALIGKPRLLIADEPTTALDVTVQRRILDLMRTLCSGEGMALILVSHDLGVVRSTCETLAVMYSGRTVEAGPVSSIEATPAHPYTQALLGADLSRATKGQPLTSLPPASDEITPADTACSFARRCRDVVGSCCERSASLRPLADRADHSTACWRRHAGEI